VLQAVRNDFDGYNDLISLLVLWHRLEDASSALGYPPECPSCREYLTSRQYDDVNGAFETHERGIMALRVGRAADGLEEPYRTAIFIFARNRATGRTVWTSPRLPADKEERAELVANALAMLAEIV
jgi:hypothetical protein